MINSSNAKFQTQKELLEFMKEFDIKVKLVAKLLNISISSVHFYRRGSYAKKELCIPQDTIDILKTRYKNYMLEKLNSI